MAFWALLQKVEDWNPVEQAYSILYFGEKYGGPLVMVGGFSNWIC